MSLENITFKDCKEKAGIGALCLGAPAAAYGAWKSLAVSPYIAGGALKTYGISAASLGSPAAVYGGLKVAGAAAYSSLINFFVYGLVGAFLGALVYGIVNIFRRKK